MFTLLTPGFREFLFQFLTTSLAFFLVRKGNHARLLLLKGVGQSDLWDFDIDIYLLSATSHISNDLLLSWFSLDHQLQDSLLFLLHPQLQIEYLPLPLRQLLLLHRQSRHQFDYFFVRAVYLLLKIRLTSLVVQTIAVREGACWGMLTFQWKRDQLWKFAEHLFKGMHLR